MTRRLYIERFSVVTKIPAVKAGSCDITRTKEYWERLAEVS